MKTQDKDQISSASKSLESNDKMQGMRPPAFGFANNSGGSDPKPNGGIQPGNDYFDEKGTYLYTDVAATNEIRIINAGIWDFITSQIPVFAKCEEEDGNRLVKVLLEKSQNLKSFDLGEDGGEDLLGGICDYYYSKIGISGVNTGSAPDSYSLAHTTVDGKGERKVAISTYNGGLNAPELGENKMNFINVLVHEKVHYFEHFEDVKGLDGKSKTQYLGVEPEEEGGGKRHLESFWSQVNHWTWEQTDIGFKTWELKKVGMYLTDFNQEDPYASNELKIKFEKKCKFRFGEIWLEARRNTIIWD